MKERMKSRILRAIDEGIFSICVVGVVGKEGERFVLPFGVAEDAIFDVASVTKVVPTALLAKFLIQEGKLSLDGQVIEYIPELENQYRSEVLVRHLLEHTVGYGPGFRLSTHKEKAPEEILQAVYSAPLEHRPGEQFFYTNAASVLLGLIVERVCGRRLDEFAEEVLFRPLGMDRTTFHPLEKFRKDEIVPTEIDSWRGREIRGEAHDESAWKLTNVTSSQDVTLAAVGSAGLFSTASDLLKVLGMLLGEGALKTRFASLGQESFMKTGFTGCSIHLDAEKGMGLVILSNYIYPHRKKDSVLINDVRKDVADIVFAQ